MADPLSVSASVAGSLSLALEITKILSAYVSDVKSAPDDARTLLTEITALCHALDQLINLLRNDVKGNFAPISALYVVIMACQEHIQDLYKKMKKLQLQKNSLKGIIDRTVKWPLNKDEYRSTLATLQRFAQTFQFSLTISNWSVHTLCVQIFIFY
jgi:hypothetical protein